MANKFIISDKCSPEQRKLFESINRVIDETGTTADKLDHDFRIFLANQCTIMVDATTERVFELIKKPANRQMLLSKYPYLESALKLHPALVRLEATYGEMEVAMVNSLPGNDDHDKVFTEDDIVNTFIKIQDSKDIILRQLIKDFDKKYPRFYDFDKQTMHEDEAGLYDRIDTAMSANDDFTRITTAPAPTRINPQFSIPLDGALSHRGGKKSGAISQSASINLPHFNLLQKFADGRPFIDTSLLFSTIDLGNVVLESAYHDNYVSNALIRALSKPLANREGFIKDDMAMIGPVLTSINTMRGTTEARPPRGLSRLHSPAKVISDPTPNPSMEGSEEPSPSIIESSSPERKPKINPAPQLVIVPKTKPVPLTEFNKVVIRLRDEASPSGDNSVASLVKQELDALLTIVNEYPQLKQWADLMLRRHDNTAHMLIAEYIKDGPNQNTPQATAKRFSEAASDTATKDALNRIISDPNFANIVLSMPALIICVAGDRGLANDVHAALVKQAAGGPSLSDKKLYGALMRHALAKIGVSKNVIDTYYDAPPPKPLLPAAPEKPAMPTSPPAAKPVPQPSPPTAPSPPHALKPESSVVAMPSFNDLQETLPEFLLEHESSGRKLTLEEFGAIVASLTEPHAAPNELVEKLYDWRYPTQPLPFKEPRKQKTFQNIPFSSDESQEGRLASIRIVIDDIFDKLRKSTLGKVRGVGGKYFSCEESDKQPYGLKFTFYNASGGSVLTATVKNRNITISHREDAETIRTAVESALINQFKYESLENMPRAVSTTSNVGINGRIPPIVSDTNKTKKEYSYHGGQIAIIIRTVSPETPLMVSIPLGLADTPENRREPASKRADFVAKVLVAAHASGQCPEKRAVVSQLKQAVNQSGDDWLEEQKIDYLRGYEKPTELLFPLNHSGQTTHLRPVNLYIPPGGNNPLYHAEFNISVKQGDGPKTEVRFRDFNLHTTNPVVAEARANQAIEELKSLTAEYAEKHPNAAWHLPDKEIFAPASADDFGHLTERKLNTDILNAMTHYESDMVVDCIPATDRPGAITLRVMRGNNLDAFDHDCNKHLAKPEVKNTRENVFASTQTGDVVPIETTFVIPEEYRDKTDAFVAAVTKTFHDSIEEYYGQRKKPRFFDETTVSDFFKRALTQNTSEILGPDVSLEFVKPLLTRNRFTRRGSEEEKGR